MASRMAKKNVGTMPCSECGNEIVVKENENGTLSYSCAWCDDSNYAKFDTVKNAGWRKRMKPLETAPAAKSQPKKADSGLIL